VYPASYECENLIAVAATDHDDAKASFSCYGLTSVDLGAPGVSVYSTFPTFMTFAMASRGFSTNYETISGTSMATPHVAGACALLFSANPEAGAALVKNVIGGEITDYTQMMTEAREQAVQRMVEDAESKGANAIVSARFATSMIMQSASEVLAYGTAVILE